MWCNCVINSYFCFIMVEVSNFNRDRRYVNFKIRINFYFIEKNLFYFDLWDIINRIR